MSDDALIQAHADLVYATCLRYTDNAQDAADVSQEVFIAWLRQRGRIRGPVAAWLHGTARQRALDWLRRGHRRRTHERAVDAAVAVDADPCIDDVKGQLDASLAELAPRERALLIEHHVLGLSQEALAARWRVSQATVSRHLARAIERLRRSLAARGVTAADALVLPESLGGLRAEPCPIDLVEPLLAQARVPGGGALVSATTVGTWWMSWLALTAATTAGLVLLGAAGFLAWRAHVAAGIPADPVATALAELPPATRLAVPPENGSPRYPSIEALIDRLPPVDNARQARIRAWLTRDDHGAALTRGHGPGDTVAAEPGKAAPPVSVPSPLSGGDRELIASAEPLLAELSDASASLTAAGWLAQDYQAGRYRCWGDVLESLRVLDGAFAQCRALVQALARQALATDAPADALVDLDRFCGAIDRQTVTVVEAMRAFSIDRARDDAYLRLAIRGTLSESDLRRWCREPPLATRQIEEGFLGESLLFSLPRLDDYRRWGEAGLLPQGPPAPGTRPGLIEWLERPMTMRAMLTSERLLARIRLAMSGRDHVSAIMREQRDTVTALMAPNLAESGQTAAQARLTHTGKRLTAWLIDSARRGHPLPVSLDDALAAVADGRDLLGGSDATYGLTYRRLSDSRFRLEIDPRSASPAYARPERLPALVHAATAPEPDGQPPPSVVIRDAVWEADVQHLQEPAAETESVPEVREPMPPWAVN